MAPSHGTEVRLTPNPCGVSSCAFGGRAECLMVKIDTKNTRHASPCGLHNNCKNLFHGRHCDLLTWIPCRGTIQTRLILMQGSLFMLRCRLTAGLSIQYGGPCSGFDFPMSPFVNSPARISSSGARALCCARLPSRALDRSAIRAV